jgi:carbonic anhydrase
VLLLPEKFTGWHFFGPTRLPACLENFNCAVFSQLANTDVQFVRINTSFSIMAEGSL